jgi:ribosomal protein S2
MEKSKNNIVYSDLYLQKILSESNSKNFNSFLINKHNNNGIYDLKKTFLVLKKTLNFIENIVSRNGQIVFLGHNNYSARKTKQSLLDLKLKQLCSKYNQTYLEFSWKGGSLTNNVSLKETYKNLNKKSSNIKRKNQEEFQRLKFNKLFKDVVNLKKMPQALISFSYNKSIVAFNEAKILKIPTICLVNPNSKSNKLVDYPIIGDDLSETNINFYMHLIERAIQRGIIKNKKYGKTF